MAFSLKTFFLDLVELAPAAIALAKGIQADVPSETNTQIATQALQAAGGLGQALAQAQGDTTLSQELQVAQNVTQSILTSIAAPPVAIQPPPVSTTPTTTTAPAAMEETFVNAATQQRTIS